MKRIPLILTVLLFAAALPLSAQNKPVLLNGSIGIPASNHWRIAFEIREGDRIDGWFRVARHDIDCMVMDAQNYELFEKGYDPFVLYSSGRVTSATLRTLRPRPGTYYLVFNNKYSLATAKTVNGFIGVR